MGGFFSKPRPRNLKPKVIISRSLSSKTSTRSSSVNSMSSIPSTNSNDTPNYFRYFKDIYESSETVGTLNGTIDGLQLAHYLLRGLWGDNYSAPVADILKTEGSRVLDIRCGPGTWILEMSDEFPTSYFTGIDVDKLYPTEIKPRNVVQEIIRVLKPEGHFEISLSEIHWYNGGPIAKQWMTTITKELKAKNVEYTSGSKIIEALEKTGRFSQIHIDEKNSPIGSWGGSVGETSLYILKDFIKNLKPIFESIITYNNEKTYEDMINDLINEIEEQNMYFKTKRFWTMKQ
ncbi:12063_t:CDS:2 [Cetraspora pellucida]|uniref:12063_t:CDS:1 n=1 Tax=Cetraspora pellucida TaxID=1433469 RepID=A0A9N9J244_9GLOM|nr:12063_t:CDS:2 [Cetraspora pellucida]